MNNCGCPSSTRPEATQFVFSLAAPPAFALKPHSSVSPHMSLVSFKLLLLRWNLGQVFVR